MSDRMLQPGSLLGIVALSLVTACAGGPPSRAPDTSTGPQCERYAVSVTNTTNEDVNVYQGGDFVGLISAQQQTAEILLPGVAPVSWNWASPNPPRMHRGDVRLHLHCI